MSTNIKCTIFKVEKVKNLITLMEGPAYLDSAKILYELKGLNEIQVGSLNNVIEAQVFDLKENKYEFLCNVSEEYYRASLDLFLKESWMSNWPIVSENKADEVYKNRLTEDDQRKDFVSVFKKTKRQMIDCNAYFVNKGSVYFALQKVKANMEKYLKERYKLETIKDSIEYYKLSEEQKDSLLNDINSAKEMEGFEEDCYNAMLGLIGIFELMEEETDWLKEDVYMSMEVC